jgi:hypothetical protein
MDNFKPSTLWIISGTAVIVAGSLLLFVTQLVVPTAADKRGGSVDFSTEGALEPSAKFDFSGDTGGQLTSASITPPPHDAEAEAGPEWEGQRFPEFIQVPGDVEVHRIMASDELLLSNGMSLRVTSCKIAEYDEPLLLIETGDGYGGIVRRGFFDASRVKIEHDPSRNSAIYQRVHQAGFGKFAMSSLDDERIYVQTPNDPMMVVDFLLALQELVGSSGEIQLIPASPKWGDFKPSHGDQFVRLAQ